jgi:hypothetical protein
VKQANLRGFKPYRAEKPTAQHCIFRYHAKTIKTRKTTMSDKKSNDSRRKLLKSIAAGSGAVVAGKTLPEAWIKPVVDSVMLPAHAETTDDTGGDYFGSFNFAGEVPVKLCIQCVGSTCSAKALEDSIYYYEGSGSLGEDMILDQLTDCDSLRVKLKVESVNGVATGQFTFISDGDEDIPTQSFSIPMAACGISAADDHCEEEEEDEAKSENRR